MKVQQIDFDRTKLPFEVQAAAFDPNSMTIRHMLRSYLFEMLLSSNVQLGPAFDTFLTIPIFRKYELDSEELMDTLYSGRVNGNCASSRVTKLFCSTIEPFT